MYGNPGDIPELVAILREPDGSPDSQLVEVINVSTMQSVAGWSSGGTPESFPTSSAYN
jgi:nucleoporin NUP159